MSSHQNKPSDNANQQAPTVASGNASNPNPRIEEMEPSEGNQLLGKKAENYLREAGNIEDMPDAKDEQEMNEAIRKKEASS